MKCIQHRETGRVTRVKDRAAAQLVLEGRWGYIPKQVYKDLTRPVAKTEE